MASLRLSMEQIHTSQLEVERARLEHERAEALTELRHTLMMSHREDMEGVESRWAERLTAMEKRLEESSQRKGKLKISNNVVLNVALAYCLPTKMTGGICKNGLKTLDTIGYCQRPVFSLAVAQFTKCIHKITNL